MTQRHDLTTTQTPLTELKPHPRNARNGDTEAIAHSLLANGQYRPIVLARGGVILAGNHTYAAAMELGWDTIATVSLDVDPNSEAGLRIMLADNKTADLGDYDDALLLDLLRSVADLEGTGYTEDDLEHLIHMEEDFYDGAIPKDRPEKRQATVDLIYSAKDWQTSLVAHLAGWGQGYISTSLPGSWDTLAAVTATLRAKPEMTFIDNEWKDYDHAAHCRVVGLYSPKYATTRDLMTRQQCEEAGVAYYTVEETIALAEDVAAAGAQNVILIPKFDCINDLPTHVGGVPIVLGYSVPSSYGRTNLDPARFAGWPVHLLGGSWSSQKGLCAMLGDDVVSLDNNYLYRQAMYGQVQLPESVQSLSEMLGGVTISKALPLLTTFLSLATCYADAASWGGAVEGDEPTPTEPIEGDER